MTRERQTYTFGPLERRGLVKVSADPTDRRSRRLSLTRKGRTLLANASPIWEDAHLKIEALLPEGDPDRLRSNLRALS